MGWLMWVSFKSNWYKYWLAILGLAAAVAVSSIGISAAALMWQISKHPILSVIGGELMVLDSRVEFIGEPGKLRSGNLYDNMSYSEVTAAINKVLPRAQTTGTLVTMAMHEVGSRAMVATIFGRDDRTENWMYSALINEGENLSPDNDGQAVLVVPGSRSGTSTWGEAVGGTRWIHTPFFDQDAGSWELAGGVRTPFTIIGTTKQPSHGNALTSLKTLQRLTGAFDLVTYVGVALDNPLLLEQDKQTLEQALAATHPELQVLSVNELGELMVADFAKLEKTAAYYTPVMLLLSVLIVVVTALTMRHARKREMCLLRTIGLDALQLKLLFIVECLAVAFTGSLLGVGGAALLSSMFFRAYTISILPAVAGVTVTFCVALAITSSGKGKEFTELLRNP